MSIRFLCDSTCDLTSAQAAEAGVAIIPLKVLFGEEEYYDRIDMQPEEFFDRLSVSRELPKTSQPSPEAFLPVFREVKEAGDDLICILLAGSLSGTCQSALIAKDIVEYDRIHIIDSGQASLGAQLLLSRALALAGRGEEAVRIVEILEQEKNRVCIYLMVDTLLYLQKGGRLSLTGMVAGNALNLRPVLAVREGKVQVAGLARGMKGAWEKVMKLLEKDGGMDEERGYLLGYTGKRECLNGFERFAASRLCAPCVSTVAVGCVIGVHVGPGANAVAVFLKE